MKQLGLGSEPNAGFVLDHPWEGARFPVPAKLGESQAETGLPWPRAPNTSAVFHRLRPRGQHWFQNGHPTSVGSGLRLVWGVRGREGK